MLWMVLRTFSRNYYRPQQSWGKVMFLHMSVILFTGGAGIPACIAAGLRGGGWYPSKPCRFPGPHPGGKLKGIWLGESPGPHPRGIWSGGSPGPNPRGKLRGIWPGGSSGPHPRGKFRGIWSGGSIPACTEAGPPPPRWLLLREVRILLECILVYIFVHRIVKVIRLNNGNRHLLITNY